MNGDRPTIQNGDLLVVDKSRTPKTGDVVTAIDGQHQSVIVIDQLRQVVTKCAHQRPPWHSLIIIRHHRSSAPPPSSAALTQRRGRHTRRSQAAQACHCPAWKPLIGRWRSSWGAPAAPSLLHRRDGCWLLRAGVKPRLVPGPDRGGGRETNAVVVIVVRRYAGLVVPRLPLCWPGFCLWPNRFGGGIKDKLGLSNLEDDEISRPYRSRSVEIDWLRGRLAGFFCKMWLPFLAGSLDSRED